MTNCQLSNLLVISATKMEMSYVDKIADFNTLVTGIGIANTIINTQNYIYSKRPELIIQIGICGAIDKSLEIGQVVVVESDFIADIGAWREEHKKFTAFESKLFHSTKNSFPFKNVSGRTVNMACNPMLDNHHADIETMEGAAILEIANLNNIRVIQLRAVSNYIDSPRADWKIETAMQNLALALKSTIFELYKVGQM